MAANSPVRLTTALPHGIHHPPNWAQWMRPPHAHRSALRRGDAPADASPIPLHNRSELPQMQQHHIRRVDEDSREFACTNERHTEVLRIRNRRQEATAHPYGPIAGTLGACALITWGSILRDARADPHTTGTRAYLAWLAFAIVLGIAASAATVLWASVLNTRRLAADGDRICEYDAEQQAKRDAQQAENIAQAVLATLRKEEHEARQKSWEQIAAAERARLATGTTSTHGRARTTNPDAEPSPVIRFPHGRQSSPRNSG